MRAAPDVGRDVTGEKGLDVEWMVRRVVSARSEPKRQIRRDDDLSREDDSSASPAASACDAAGHCHASRSLDVYLQCDGETRSRLLAFSAGNLETEDQRQADRRLRIEIRNSKRVSVVDLPSGEILFGPSQCRISTMKPACEAADGNHHRQMFISRTSGDAMFEGYTETSDEKSALVVERYSCAKEDREPLF